MNLRRLLFASVHSYVDPASGAAGATRDVLELLSARGIDCRALSAGVLDFERETPLDSTLGLHGMPFTRAGAQLAGGGSVEVFDLELHGVRATLLPTKSSRPEKAPDPAETAAYLDLGEQVMDRFRPQVLLTYGGHEADLILRERARRRGIAVAFHLHNFAYDNRRAFEGVAGVVVPSEYARREHARRMGLKAAVIPYPIRPGRVVAADPEPEFLTFVNPQPAKGAIVAARIAAELGRRRPDVRIQVAEGRGTAEGMRLAAESLGLPCPTNIRHLGVAADPRELHRTARAVIVPSLWRETFCRVAAEALANGIPVLASDRGALPETLGDAGFLFTLPESCTPGAGLVSARDVAPWLAVIERLWDDPSFESRHQELARIEAKRWDENTIVEQFLAFFETLHTTHEII